jgi:hypothetical protein
MFCRSNIRACAFLFVFVFLALIANPALRADTVVLKNGDRLTGTAVKLEGGKLTFKTAYADSIAIAWDQVSRSEGRQAAGAPAGERQPEHYLD